MFEKDRWIGPVHDGSPQQISHRVAVASKNHGEPWNGRHEALGALTVGRSVSASSTAWCSDHKRNLSIGKHSREFHRMVKNLIHAERQEIGEHDLHNRSRSG